MEKSAENTIHRQKLIHILQLAYSGEKAAAMAYAGHWRSLKPGVQRETIKRIQLEEVEHRANVGKILQDLHASPALWREILMTTIGAIASVGCFFTGWFLPMYFAGKLEHENVREYDVAAGHAHALGMDQYLPELKAMSKTEAEHELFFSECIRDHWLLAPAKLIFKWDPVTEVLLQEQTE
jgi:hypothetical protein